MSINIGPPQMDGLKPKIAVIGVGGAGGNAIANMIASHVEGVEFLVANTDAQALNASPAERRLQLGAQITQGLGAGSMPEVGRAAAEESISDLETALDGMHMVFIAAGMGGGTGTGAAPVIARAARDKGILTVGVVTKPFSFEGARRMRSADAGIEELQKHVDTLIVIPNQNLFMVAEAKTTFIEAFRMADEVLQQGVRGITDLMVRPGLVNLDFADVRSVMRDAGKAMMGTGEAEGEGRALAAAQQAIANPLLDGVSMAGARGVIISISGGEDLGLYELQEAGDHIRELVDSEANIIWGSAFNPELSGKIRVSVVATGLDPAAASVQRQGLNFGRPAPALTPAASLAPAAPPSAPAPLTTPAPSLATMAPPPAETSVEDAPIPQAFEPAPEPVLPTPRYVDDALGDDAAEADASGDDDALMLGAEQAADDDGYGAPQDAAVDAEDDFPSIQGQNYMPAAPEPAAPAAEPAPTLFEKMKALSRMEGRNGLGDGEDPDGGDDPNGGGESRFPNIPRFLGRQSN